MENILLFYELFVLFLFVFSLHLQKYIKICNPILMKGLKHFHDSEKNFWVSNRFYFFTMSSLTEQFFVNNFKKSSLVKIQIFIYPLKL